MNRRQWIAGALATWLALAAAPVGAQRTETGFLDRSLTQEGTEYRYQVYLPRGFSAATKWPVILALHGGGEYGSDGIRQTVHGLAAAIRQHPERVPAVVVFPQARADRRPGWQLDAGRMALKAVDAAIAEFSGDASRVYLTGYSAGGNGAWFLASRHPERFAAVVVVCGFVSDFTGRSSAVHYPALSTADDVHADVARQVASLPVWIFHGDADPVVPVQESRRMFAALKAARAEVQYTELPGVSHEAWTPAYERGELFEWLLKQRRR
ncbi:prolyl oligopeptidase family serine peptidase [Ideonella sp.]|uniref:carboxylesterase family protein n=1 Tax=Ideonella sp. TaxID=1929293 RepID=UPI0035B2B5AA